VKPAVLAWIEVGEAVGALPIFSHYLIVGVELELIPFARGTGSQWRTNDDHSRLF